MEQDRDDLRRRSLIFIPSNSLGYFCHENKSTHNKPPAYHPSPPSSVQQQRSVQTTAAVALAHHTPLPRSSPPAENFPAPWLLLCFARPWALVWRLLTTGKSPGENGRDSCHGVCTQPRLLGDVGGPTREGVVPSSSVRPYECVRETDGSAKGTSRLSAL